MFNLHLYDTDATQTECDKFYSDRVYCRAIGLNSLKSYSEVNTNFYCFPTLVHSRKADCFTLWINPQLTNLPRKRLSESFMFSSSLTLKYIFLSSNIAPKSPPEKTRYDTSLGLLTKKFVDLLAQSSDGVLDLNLAAETLQVISDPKGLQ